MSSFTLVDSATLLPHIVIIKLVGSIFDSIHYWIFLQELFSACNPIVNKPKPKVELPKEETPAEQNGPVDGQEKPQEEAADKGTTEAAGNPTSETTDNKPDMDLD